MILSWSDSPMLMSSFVVFHIFAHFLPHKSTYHFNKLWKRIVIFFLNLKKGHPLHCSFINQIHLIKGPILTSIVNFHQTLKNKYKKKNPLMLSLPVMQNSRFFHTDTCYQLVNTYTIISTVPFLPKTSSKASSY